MHCLTNGLVNEHLAEPEAVTAEVVERAFVAVLTAQEQCRQQESVRGAAGRRGDPFQTGSVSADRRTALAQVLYPIKRDALRDSGVTALEGVAAAARSGGMRAEAGRAISSTAGSMRESAR